MRTLNVHQITIHSFLHKFSFVSPAPAIHRAQQTQLFHIAQYENRLAFRWMEKLYQRRLQSHSRVTLTFCTIDLATMTFYHDKRFARFVHKNQMKVTQTKNCGKTTHEFRKSQQKSFE